jgi:hydrogenase maturation protein HypF
VLAEKQAWEKRVIGVSFDGTGYGDDGIIWGRELFTGSMMDGFERVVHLRKAVLPGGDAAARHPLQSAAGFLAQIEGLASFDFPVRYQRSLQLIQKQVRTFETTSMGRLFDAAAALLGFIREVSFEGQAAMWLEYIALAATVRDTYPFPELDFRPLLAAAAHDRKRGRSIGEIARAFHCGVARGLCDAARRLCDANSIDTVVLSGGVFQNELLLQEVKSLMPPPIQIWTNAAVPPNDGGISLGQAALVLD